MNIRTGLVLCALVLLSACSSKFAYNNLDWLLYWYLDDYVELEGEQKDAFNAKLEDWLTWHRSEELVKYRQQLIDLQQQIRTRDKPPEDWLQTFSRGREHWYRLRGHITPELMPFAQLLTDEQIEDLFAELAEQDDKRIEKRQKKSAEKRAEEDLEDTLDQLKDWLGKLHKEQVQIILEYHPQFESNFDNWMEYRKEIQQAAKSLFEQRDTLPDFQQQLLYLLNHPEQYQSAELTRISDKNRVLYAQMLAALSATLTDRQVRHLDDEIEDLVDDLTDLIGDQGS